MPADRGLCLAAGMGMSNPCRRMTGTHPARHEASGEALLIGAARSGARGRLEPLNP